MGQQAGLVLGRYGRSLVSQRTVPLASPSRIPWQAYGGEGGQRAITVQMPLTSAITEIDQDAFVGSSIENGTTVIQFDLRTHDFQQALGTTAPICWRKESYHVDGHELSTFHNRVICPAPRLCSAQHSWGGGQITRFSGLAAPGLAPWCPRRARRARGACQQGRSSTAPAD